MSRPNHIQRKAALIEKFALKEGIWPKSGNQKIVKDNKTINITRNGIIGWQDGRGGSNREKTLKDVKRDLAEFLEKKEEDFFNEDYGVVEFAHYLGLSRIECRESIDNLIGRILPSFSIFSCESNDYRAIMNVFGGLHIIYRLEVTPYAKEKTGREISILKIPLSVRYPIDGFKVMSQNLRRVRCKMVIHSYRIAGGDFDYDGYVTPGDGAGFHHWAFQARDARLPDVMYFITGEPEAESDFMLGTMVSRSQDRPAKPTIWPIVIEKIKGEENLKNFETDDPFDDVETVFMREVPALLDPKDVGTEIINRLKQAQEFAAFPKL